MDSWLLFCESRKGADLLLVRNGSGIVVDDLRGGGTPYTVVSADIFQRGVDRADSIRLPRYEGMQGDCHHAWNVRGFPVEPVELVANELAEFFGRELLVVELRRIIALQRIRYREYRAAIEGHAEWQVITDPIANIVDAFIPQDVQGAPCLRKASTKPSAWP